MKRRPALARCVSARPLTRPTALASILCGLPSPILCLRPRTQATVKLAAAIPPDVPPFARSAGSCTSLASDAGQPIVQLRMHGRRWGANVAPRPLAARLLLHPLDEIAKPLRLAAQVDSLAMLSGPSHGGTTARRSHECAGREHPQEALQPANQRVGPGSHITINPMDHFLSQLVGLDPRRTLAAQDLASVPLRGKRAPSADPPECLVPSGAVRTCCRTGWSCRVGDGNT